MFHGRPWHVIGSEVGATDEAVASAFARFGVTTFRRILSDDVTEALYLVDAAELERIDENAVVREISALFGGRVKVAVMPDRTPGTPPGTILL